MWRQHPLGPWIHRHRYPSRRNTWGTPPLGWISVSCCCQSRRRRCSLDRPQRHPLGTWTDPRRSPRIRRRSARGRSRRISGYDGCCRRWRSRGLCCSPRCNEGVPVGRDRFRRNRICPRTCRPTEIPAKTDAAWSDYTVHTELRILSRYRHRCFVTQIILLVCIRDLFTPAIWLQFSFLGLFSYYLKKTLPREIRLHTPISR